MSEHKLCRHSAMHQNPVLCAVCLLSQNLNGQSLNYYNSFLARKYASFGHTAYCCNHYVRLSHLRKKNGKSPPQHNENYRMIVLYYFVLCIGILWSWHANDVMIFGCQANFGTQKNNATETYGSMSLVPVNFSIPAHLQASAVIQD